LFFVVANTALDAFIASWEAKRFYERASYALVRVVRNSTLGSRSSATSGQKRIRSDPAGAVASVFTRNVRDASISGYVSGHSTVSGACSRCSSFHWQRSLWRVPSSHRWRVYGTQGNVAEMQAMNGQPPKGLPESKDVVLALPTFTATADMAGISRVMGGYHIQADNVEGLKLGRSVAEYSWPKYHAYFDGKLP